VKLEKKHGRISKEKFGEALDGKKVICLHIPDLYRYMGKQPRKWETKWY
jgi:predicted protein tyrosine phosphatase